ncbi:amine oxidase catalytic domain-containing protein [Zopfia rhizophila CBS 207.26]|uniref:Amine oxidase n=1 Tax=Zopfia rhizophila CBS 207.26 TaxID=1314779 RepID=A0A6A6DLK5_9PEZI|nr:amine oxidase catalytic domain-containing protein [Zopfia rhizophila CBS 207.26]
MNLNPLRLLAYSSAIALGTSYLAPPPYFAGPIARQVGSNGQCSAEQPKSAAPHKNIWKGLTKNETVSVLQYLHSNSSGLNLTAAESAGSWDNRIALVELLQPNKTDTISFLANANGTNGPPRYARATILFGATADPYVQDYMVGPLPVTSSTKIQPLTFLYNNKSPGKIMVANADGDSTTVLFDSIGSSIDEITRKFWNATLADGLSLWQINPVWREDDKTICWYGFMNSPTSNFDTQTLLPLGLYVRADITGRDTSKWKTTGWYYNGKFYETTEDFRKSASAPGFEILKANIDGPWAGTDKRGEPLPFDELPPPMPVSQGPKRFSIDANEQYVSWMDFSFYFSVSRNTGVRLFHIKYKGKKILYELGLEEALTHYAGNDPVQSGTAYFDSLPGFGPGMVSLVDGYDCPYYSTYMDATYPDGESIYTQTKGICLFEMDMGYPIQRHSAGRYASVTKNIAFTLRSISTIGNYDFLTSYNFFLDGSMEVSVRASGYIQSAFYAKNEEYGFKIHDQLSGSIHDHILTFKADFDILGEKNSLQKVEFVPKTEEYSWSKGKPRNTMKASKSFITNEADSKINWAPNSAALYSIVNKDAKNKFGEFPGYRITPSTGSVTYLTIQNSSNIPNAANFADHAFYVTKQKDTEAQAAHPYNEMDPYDPLIDFGKFFDGDSLDQEDLVVWFNLGMHHIPHTGDLPNTVFSTAHSAMTIEPMNYLDGDPSRATTQQVRIDYGDNDTIKNVETFGARHANCSIDLSHNLPDLYNYRGRLAVRKYPYDPSRQEFRRGTERAERN